MTEPEKTVAVDALTHYTADQLSDLLTLVIGLAARRHSETVRAALADVFDLQQHQKDLDRIKGDGAVALREVIAIRELMVTLEDRCERLESWYDKFEHRLNKAASKVGRIIKAVEQATAQQETTTEAK
jgi:predicted  nucleic acid-binding Zn-ribbon protein